MFAWNAVTNSACVGSLGVNEKYPAVSSGETADEVLERMRKQLVSSMLKPSSESRGILPAHMEELLAAMAAGIYDESLNVKTLKATCGARDNNISSQFKRHCRGSIKDCIEYCRMNAAAAVLAACDEPIVDVAYRIGYSHVQTFQRVFRRHFHCTPGAYRDAARNRRTQETHQAARALCAVAI